MNSRVNYSAADTVIHHCLYRFTIHYLFMANDLPKDFFFAARAGELWELDGVLRRRSK